MHLLKSGKVVNFTWSRMTDDTPTLSTQKIAFLKSILRRNFKFQKKFISRHALHKP